MTRSAPTVGSLEPVIEALVDVVVARVLERLDAAPPRLLSPAEFAARAGIARSTLYQLLGSGAIRSTRVGRRRLIPESEVGRLLEGVER
jgi:excisionase family DNA binding protein